MGHWQERYFETAFEMKSNKVELVPVEIANNQLARNSWFAFGLPRIVRACKPAIVHLSFPVPIFRSLFSCSVVTTVHDLYPYDSPESFNPFNRLCKQMFFKRCLGESDAVACVSEETRLSLERRFPKLSSRVPVRLVHNYADFSSSNGTISVPGIFQPFLLTVAQQQPNKRLGLLLRAFAQLRDRGLVDNQLQLLVVGSEGAESEALRNLSGLLELNDSVQWLPQLYDRELAWLYQNCEASVVSSRIEGFCLPLLEALFFNCRVVASDISVFHEIAGDIPVYFDISHSPVENLASAILRAINTPPRSARPMLRFSRERTAAECLELYALLLPELSAENWHRIETSSELCVDARDSLSQ